MAELSLKFSLPTHIIQSVMEGMGRKKMKNPAESVLKISGLMGVNEAVSIYFIVLLNYIQAKQSMTVKNIRSYSRST